MSERDMEKEETKITKKRTTALKIVVDEETRNNAFESRAFLGRIFDYPEYTDQKSEVLKSCIVTTNGRQHEFNIYEELQQVFKENGLDITLLNGYKESTGKEFMHSAWKLDARVKEVTGISESTYLTYKFGSSEETNGVTLNFLKFELETSGKTKTEIKTIHKENVCKLLNYLRMRKVPFAYDCEWSFEGNRACQL